MAVPRDASSRAVDIGRTLGGRYRLVAPLGSGASATVYLAEDVQLARNVAVKVLHPSLASDAAFLKRFRAEAQAAAALSHPNIVAVFDWGTDGGDEDNPGSPYLVTEYLAGGSLRAMLDRGRRLSPSQALLVGLETARGLEYAHARGLVHRDIKPANLLFGDDGRLRIADFGLARAIAEAAWTEPAGVVLGTARYASPEQAKGMGVDGTTDVYSLALTLVEAVTGAVPFAADTTVATLMGRIDKLMPVSAELGQLAPVVEKAGRPDPAERSTAAELARALVQTARLMARPAPLPLVRLTTFDLDMAPTSMNPTTALSPGDGPPPVTTAAPPAPAAPFVPPVAPLPPLDAPLFDQAPPRVMATAERAVVGGDAPPADAPLPYAPSPFDQEAGADADDPVDRGPEPVPAVRGRHRPRRLLVVLVVAVLAGLGAVGVLLLKPKGPKSYAVTSYVGQDIGVVENAISQNQWDVVKESRNDEEAPVGQVIAQTPETGNLSKGGTLKLWVSSGPALRPLPELNGLAQAEVDAALTRVGLTAEYVGDGAFSEDVEAGKVVTWSVKDQAGLAAGQEVVKGTVVQVTLSKGPEPRTRPSLKDMTWDQAVAALTAVQLKAERQPDEYSDTVAAGIVIRAEPAAGEKVERDSVVKVTISLGPQLFEVPNLVGMTFEDAKAAIATTGVFDAGSVSGPATGTVAATSPPAGEQHVRGTKIDLTLG